jgi:hypothetical protein
MTPIPMGNQLRDEKGPAPGRDDRKGKRAIMSRRAWAVVALLAAGWFLHDTVWHLMLATFGINTLMGMEFSLPDLGAYHIYPDRAIQTFAFFFALVAAGLLLWLGLRLRQRR